MTSAVSRVPTEFLRAAPHAAVSHRLASRLSHRFAGEGRWGEVKHVEMFFKALLKRYIPACASPCFAPKGSHTRRFAFFFFLFTCCSHFWLLSLSRSSCLSFNTRYPAVIPMLIVLTLRETCSHFFTALFFYAVSDRVRFFFFSKGQHALTK